jgi:hypothetical protein
MELDHDRSLLELCATLGISEDPSTFVNRDSARKELEEAARSRGVDLGSLEQENETLSDGFSEGRLVQQWR